MEWFRLYNEFASDPKVQSMSEAMQRRLVMVFCLKSAGHLPGLDETEVAFALSLKGPELDKTKKLFLAKGFIDQEWDVPNWEKRQRSSDSSAERTRHYRDRKRQPVTSQARHGDALEERREEEKRTEERENVTVTGDEPPLPPPIVLGLGPEFDQVGEFAIQLMGEVSWGRWVMQQGMCGHSAPDIRACVEECAGAGKFSQAYAASKLRGWASEGGRPKRKGENNGRTAVQQRPEETRAKLARPDLPRTPQFAGVNRYWDDIEAGRKPNPKDLAI